jgi:spore coat protein JC
MVAEQKTRSTYYEYLIRLSNDPGMSDTLKFLREREVVHFQRFGETLNLVYD